MGVAGLAVVELSPDNPPAVVVGRVVDVAAAV